MVEDLNFDVEIIGCEIIRSDKGLALSSRNSYLTDIEKEESLVLNRTLNMLKEKIKLGSTNVSELIKIGEENILTVKSTKVDYLKIVDIDTMEDVVEVDRSVLIALAVYINDKVRLIDNIEIIKE